MGMFFDESLKTHTHTYPQNVTLIKFRSFTRSTRTQECFPSHETQFSSLNQEDFRFSQYSFTSLIAFHLLNALKCCTRASIIYRFVNVQYFLRKRCNLYSPLETIKRQSFQINIRINFWRLQPSVPLT